jgi:hypothetical protein
LARRWDGSSAWFKFGSIEGTPEWFLAGRKKEFWSDEKVEWNAAGAIVKREGG